MKSAWKTEWWPSGPKIHPAFLPKKECTYINGGWNPLPLESDPSVVEQKYSTVRFIVSPDGMITEILSHEALGEPKLSLHQCHYAVTSGTKLGSLTFGVRDDPLVSLSATIDGPVSLHSRPAAVTLSVAPEGSVNPTQPILTGRADGRVAIGGGCSSLPSTLVSVGIYRPGIMQLPSVEKFDDLKVGSFVNGAIVYCKNLERVLVSQGGQWHGLLTEVLDQNGSVALPRQIGQPRRDGRFPSFGPSLGIHREPKISMGED
jgi:hypothetical protein